MDEDFWRSAQEREQPGKTARSGFLNIALLFGTAIVALALIIPPMMSGAPEKRRLAFGPDEVDNLTTGSISDGAGSRYTIRRSVLQETPGSVCIVQGYGTDGGC
jgi:hypothetical protein